MAEGPTLDDSVRRRALLRAGNARVVIEFHDTVTADLIWRALPLHSVAETWGDSIHFDTPLKGGRDRTARINGRAGEVYFWAEDERIVIAWGPTPISRPDEIRLMRPCNLFAHAIDDASVFDTVTPGEKVSLERIR